MQPIVYSKARNNLRKIIDKACDDHEEFVITTKNNKNAVLMSLEEYSAIKETLYLLTSQTNRKRLYEAVDQIENSDFLKKDIDL